RLRHVPDHPLAHRLVVERAGDVVAGGGHAVVEVHLDVEQQRLADPPLPVVDADPGFDFEGFDEDGVHGQSRAWWLVVGDWWLVVGGWWLVVGGWWLVVGGWWLVVGGW